MDVNRELTGVLREVVQFLECLREVKLPTPLESIRGNLLIRSKQITMLAVERIGTHSTPEAYLNMSPAAPKGLVTTNQIEIDLEEYVGAEEPRKQQKQQDYYESFQTVESNHAAIAGTGCAIQQFCPKDEKIDDRLLDIYANFSAAQATTKCLKCGTLYRKEGKKLFLFGQYRTCWVGLVESYLLIYGSNRDNRPYDVIPIRGYMARAAPNAIPKGQRKSETTFEVFCPGSRTFQFVASTPKDMEQWVAKICEMGNAERNENVEFPKTSIIASLEPSNYTEEHQNLECSNIDKAKSETVTTLTSIDKETVDSLSKTARMELTNILSSVSPSTTVTLDVTSDTGTCDTLACSTASAIAATAAPIPAPSLPTRIPRRLPSLPMALYMSQEEEEDDMYYRIEDFRDTTHMHCYNNVPISKTNKMLETMRDDARRNPVCSDRKDLSVSKEKSKKNLENDGAEQSISSQRRTTMNDNDNDIGSRNDNASSSAPTLINNNVACVDQEDKCYDDVESLLLSPRPNNERPNTSAVDKAVEPVRSPNKLQKKSFLDRVRNLKESPRKIERKITKSKILMPPAVDDQQLPTYDDAFGLINTKNTKRTTCSEKEESEYTCPPPPRPIYRNPPTIVDPSEQQELYDDVGSCRKNYKEQETLQPVGVTPRKLNCIHESTRQNLDDSISRKNIDRPKSQTLLKKLDHYQTPRIKSNQREYPTDQQEELYDDIAILAEFMARQKECKDDKDIEETTRIQVVTEKRSWNRFVSGKKPKSIDSATVQETNPRSWNGIEYVDDPVASRMNTFQKLISKMENSLGKASVKTTPTVLPNKTNVADSV